jgi:hypothetical protein
MIVRIAIKKTLLEIVVTMLKVVLNNFGSEIGLRTDTLKVNFLLFKFKITIP